MQSLPPPVAGRATETIGAIDVAQALRALPRLLEAIRGEVIAREAFEDAHPIGLLQAGAHGQVAVHGERLLHLAALAQEIAEPHVRVQVFGVELHRLLEAAQRLDAVPAD